jgi:hypothetical protein
MARNGSPPRAEIVEHQPATLEQQTSGKARIQAMIARDNPRVPERSLQRTAAAATRDPATAAGCFYSIPRGGKQIEGPSVRLTELAARYWGNIEAASRIVDIGETHVTAQGVAWDLETNYTFSTEVRRRITDKSGRRFNDDMIGVTANAAASIAYREAVLRVVGKLELDPIWRQCRDVAVGDSRSMADQYNGAIEHFAKAGISEERILASLGVTRKAEVTPEHIGALRGTANALRDGEISIDTAFPPLEDPQTAVPPAGKRSYGGKKAQKEPEPDQEPPHDPATGEVKPDPGYGPPAWDDEPGEPPPPSQAELEAAGQTKINGAGF